jgi:hypothetical protein
MLLLALWKFFLLFDSILSSHVDMELEEIQKLVTPLSETSVLYNRTKQKVLVQVQAKYEFHRRIYQSGDYKIKNELKSLLFGVSVSQLIKAMIEDGSDRFLLIFLYGLRGRYNILVFADLNLLIHSSYACRIFKNFELFLYKIFTHNVYLAHNPSEEHHQLVKLLEIFWHNRVQRVARKILTRYEFGDLKNTVKEKIRFLHSLLELGSEIS